MRGWKLPLAGLPQVTQAGQFVLAEEDFSVVHLGRAHALHLHGYAADMRLGNQQFAIAPGDLTISPAGIPSSYHVDRPGRHWCIHFTFERADGPWSLLQFHQSDCAHLRELFARIAWLGATGSDEIALAAARIATQQLLLEVARLSHPLPSDDPVMKAAHFIDEHFGRPISLGDIAAAAGLSQIQLGRKFRARFGMTLFRKLLQRRANHARFLLESTDLPIWLIAERCGVPDPQHFNKFVRKMTRMSPTRIRAVKDGTIVDPDR